MLPLTALRAFDAVARRGGVGRAAEALGVTHGAISRQVGLLEARLGLPLLEGPRNARRLTGDGRRLAAEIAPAFARLEAAMETRVARPRPLVASCLSTLATRWLIPRLSALSGEAGTAVELRESYASLTSEIEGCDLAIRMLSPDDVVPKGLIATPFMANEAGLVLAPGLARPARRLLSRDPTPRPGQDGSARRRAGRTPGRRWFSTTSRR